MSHYIYTVSIPKSLAESATEARDKAYKVLEENDFAGEGGFYSSSKADWYVVGGRWSGEFSKLFNQDQHLAGLEAIKPLLVTELEKRPDLLGHLSINDHILEGDKNKVVNEAYKKVTGFDFFRDSYVNAGYEDDAMLVDTEEKAKILIENKEWADVECAVLVEGGSIDEEVYIKDMKAEDLLGKWLVLIDYHN